MMHEASLYEANCFVTLTYSNEHLPSDGSLNVVHFQEFMKRLRWHHRDQKIRFFHCGEYGEQFARPHYHACLFNYDFPDRELWHERNGTRSYLSPELVKLWGKGHCLVGDLTFESAAYTARYVMKKVTGQKAEHHYMKLTPSTGELVAVAPEYTTMSRAKGIGHDWFSKFSSDVYPSDEVVMRGFPQRPPRYYDGLYELERPEDFLLLKEARIDEARKFSRDQTPARLEVRHKVKLAQVSFLKRSYESET